MSGAFPASLADGLLALRTALSSRVLVAGVTALDAVLVIGLATLAVLVLSAWLRYVFALLQPRGPGRVSSYGRWAVVTGATDGIGRAYAFELARRGLDVVLVARNAAKLATVAGELAAAAPGRAVATIVADFAAPAGLYERLGRELAAATPGGVGVLINNVGVSYPSALFLHELEARAPGATDELINVNVVACVKMTALVLPGMIERKRGAIVNLGSVAGRMPIGSPLLAVYSGTKAFVDFFSRSLHREYASRGIDVQCQAPYFVATLMSRIRTPSLFTPSPAAFAAASVSAIGRGDSVVPYLWHAVQDALLLALPTWLLTTIIMRMHLGIRSRYLKKADAAAAAGAPAPDGKKAEGKKAK